MEEYKVGNIVKVSVTGIEKYGIFVSVDPWYNGLIHISEISNGFVKDVNFFVQIGETIYAQIIDVDEKGLQLKLSIKNINYKINDKRKKVQESPLGFWPLKEALPKWIESKIK